MNNILNDPNLLQKMLISGALGQLVAQKQAQGAQNEPQNAHKACNLNLEQHLNYADALVRAGIVDPNTGKSIKSKMTATFKTGSGAKTPDMGAAPAGTQPQTPAGTLFESDFLKARECLLNYLKNLDVELGEGDLREIEGVVLELEKAALERNAENSKKTALEALNEANEISKNRLACTALAASSAQSPPQKVFTRDEIAQMNTAEFLKNEPIINYQLQNGLL